MEINVLNVELGVSEAKLTEALASRLHRPPFLRHPKDPLLNFKCAPPFQRVEVSSKPRSVHIHVAKEQRRTDWEHHRGTAALILPEYHQGRLFLERFGEERGWVLQGKRLHFSQADRKPAEGLIESLRRLPWLSPDEVEKRNTILDRLSKPIIVRSLDFGRPCRDRVFAAEYHIDYKAKQGKLFFDPEFSLFRISDGKHIMAIRCDTVEHVVADDEANAVLLILRMPPAFEEMPDTSAPTDRPKPPETETLSKKHAPKKAVPGMKAPEPAARPRKLPPGSATPRPIDPHRPGSASPSTSRSIPGLTPSRTPSLSPLGLSTLPLRTPSGLSPPSLSSSPPTGLVSPPGLSVPPSRRMSTASTNGTAMASFAGAVDAALHAVEGGSNGQANGYAWATGHVMNGHATTNGDSNGYGRVSEYGLSNGPAQPWLGLRSRMTRFEEKHRNLAPFSSRAILVSFGQEDAVLLRRVPRTHLDRLSFIQACPYTHR